MTNIIFLDIDVVLNDEGYIIRSWNKYHTPMHMKCAPFNSKSLQNLRKIYESILDNNNNHLYSPFVILDDDELDIIFINKSYFFIL